MTRNPSTTRPLNRELRLGRAVAALLSNERTGARQNRESDGRSTVDGQLSGLLCRLGAGALAWWRIRDTELANTPAAAELHNVYRHQRLAALRHERDLVKVISLLRSAGIEPVLVKGWAIARHYPEPGLRPYGDLDLCVSPTQFAQASQVLEGIASSAGPFVDLHCGFSNIGVGKRLSLASARHAQREWEEIFARTTFANLAEKGERVEAKADVVQTPKSRVQKPESESQISDPRFQVRVLSDEDHLRILCLHLLRSGARRPSWLCDVAVLLRRQTPGRRRTDEQSPITSPTSNVQRPKSSLGRTTLDIGHSTLDSDAAFDWDTCVGRNPLHANWVATAVLLAHELLGADISHTPFASRQLPEWIVSETLEQWGGKASPTSNVQCRKTLLAKQTLDIGHWTLDWYRRWDNPIRATAAVNGEFTERPRLRYRFKELLARIPELPDHLRTLRVDRRRSRVDSPLIAQITDPVSFY